MDSTYSQWVYHGEGADAFIIEGDVEVTAPFNALIR
jgi:hypothetical protein